MRGFLVIFGYVALTLAARAAFMLGVELGDGWLDLSASEFLVANIWSIIALGLGGALLLIAGQNEFEPDKKEA